MLKPTILTSLLALGPSGIAALGINCRGSTDCSKTLGADATAMTTLHGIVANLPSGRSYANGQQIACTTGPNGGGICVFAQNTNGVNAGTAATQLGNLLYHGCAICGSSPTDYPNTNDVSKGQITVNYVGNPCHTYVGAC
ncbi:hypothetical protein MBLNU459_g4195t1 [Dothideomycetes sp. NU459]